MTAVQTQSEAAKAVGPTPVKYSMVGAQLLSSGLTTDPLAGADNLWVHAKVYSGGGENALHAHTLEDHTFFVLQGSAVFEFADGSKHPVEAFDGVFFPKGSLYRFQAQGEGNLVMLRVGACQRQGEGLLPTGFPPELRGTIADETGKVITNNQSAAKGKAPSAPVIPAAGQFFRRR